MKQIRYIVCLFASCLLMAACSSHRAEKAWIEQGESLKDSLPDSALVVLQKVKLPESLGDRWLARWCMAYGDAADKAKEPMPEASLLLSASGYLRRHGSAEQQSRMALFLGRSYAHGEDYEKAIATYADGMAIALQGKAYNQAGYISGYTGDIYFLKSNYSEALKRYKEEADYFRRAGNQRSYLFSLRDIGKMYLAKDSTARALSCFKQIESYLPSLSNADRAYMYNGFGNVYVSMGEYDKAEHYLLEANRLDSSEMAPNFLALSQLRLRKGDIPGAKMYVEMAQRPTKNILTPGAIDYTRYLIAKKENNASEALKQYEQYQAKSDSLLSQLNRTNIYEVEKRYERQQFLNDAMQSKLASQNYFTGIVLLLLLLSLSGLFYLVHIRRKERKIHEQQILIREEEAEKLHLSDELRGLQERSNQSLQAFADEIRAIQIGKLRRTAVFRKIKEMAGSLEPEQSKIRPEDWEAIRAGVDSIFIHFKDNLTQNHPNLSERDTNSCYLQFFGLSLKEEANLLGISLEGVKKIRFRLRQEFGIVSGNLNLSTYLLLLSTSSPLN